MFQCVGPGDESGEFVAAFLVIVGSITIALVYGLPAAALGLGCLLAGAGILGLLWLILTAMERLAK